MADEKVRYEVKELYVIDNTGSKPNQFLEGEDLETWYRTKIKSTPKTTTVDPKLNEKLAELSLALMNGELLQHEVKEILISEFGNPGLFLYRKERRRFEDDYKEYLKDKKRLLKENGRKLKTIFIEGESGFGKSFLANSLADEINRRKNIETQF